METKKNEFKSGVNKFFSLHLIPFVLGGLAAKAAVFIATVIFVMVAGSEVYQKYNWIMDLVTVATLAYGYIYFHKKALSKLNSSKVAS